MTTDDYTHVDRHIDASKLPEPMHYRVGSAPIPLVPGESARDPDEFAWFERKPSDTLPLTWAEGSPLEAFMRPEPPVNKKREWWRLGILVGVAGLLLLALARGLGVI